MVTLAAQAGQGGLVTIACINKATVDLGVPFDKLTAALQTCYDRYFVPVWGYPVKLYNAAAAKPTDWQLVYFDNADQAGALGYHDLTKNGQPVSKIFVKTTLADNEKVSVTACHELFEMAIDPIANLWAQAADGTEYAYEMCDAVEEDTFPVDGVAMSNFLHPAWFEPFKHPAGTRYDHLGRLKAPFTMTKGGYVITMTNGKVSQHFGSAAKEKRFQKEDRRGHRSEFRKPRGLRS
jgi:N-acetyl-beta-hexosaminidase